MNGQWIDLTRDESPSRYAPLGRWVRRNGCSIAGSLGCLSVIAIVIGPILLSARESAKSPSCQSNLKQIALGALMYAQDYDERLQPARGWMKLTELYVKNDEVFKCPTVQKTDPKAYGYAFNRLLSQKLISKVPDTAATPMHYDSDQLLRDAFDAVSTLPHPGRHNQGNTIGFVDGHVKWLKDTTTAIPFPK
jgi:prepilin-type processing-associated H-X9-DG protein